MVQGKLSKQQVKGNYVGQINEFTSTLQDFITHLSKLFGLRWNVLNCDDCLLKRENCW